MALTPTIPILNLLIIIISTNSLLTTASYVASSNKTLVAPITKNAFSFYTIPLTPNASAGFVLELTRPTIILDYSLSKYETVHSFPYNSSTCNYMQSIIGPSCGKYEGHIPEQCNPNVLSPRYGGCTPGVLVQANITFSTSNYLKPIARLTIPQIYMAEYGISYSLQSSSLAGVVALTWSPFSLPSQLSSKLHIREQFALCLPSNSSHGKPGVAFFGDIPVGLHMALKLSKTPLLKKPTVLNSGYYISIKGVMVNKKRVNLSASLNSSGYNPIQISTTDIVTTLRSDIYQPIFQAFSNATRKIPRAVDPLKRYDLCFKRSSVRSGRSGYEVPQIDLMLEGGVTWSLYGANLLLDISKHITCFAFVDEGFGDYFPSPDGAYMSMFGTIGGYMLENNFLAFDLASSKLWFSGLLLKRGITCSELDLLH